MSPDVSTALRIEVGTDALVSALVTTSWSRSSCSCTSPRTPNSVRKPRLVGRVASGRTLGDHRPDQLVGGAGAERLLSAHRHAHDTDALPVDVRAVGEVAGGRRDVSVAVPAEVHRPAVAVAMAPGVDHQDAEPVAGQHGGLVEDVGPGRAGAVQQHDGGAVRRRQVPPGEAHAIAGGHGHGLVRQSLAGRRRTDLRTGDVGRGDGRPDDERRDRDEYDGADAGTRSAGPAAGVASR